MTDAAYDTLYDELAALEAAHPELVTPESPTQRVGAPPSERFQKVPHLSPMGSLEKVTTDEALEKWADDVRKRLGGGRSRRVRARAEDRRLGDQPRLRGRALRPRRDARRRHPGRGRDAEPADDPGDPAADAPAGGRGAAGGARGARRGLHAARGLPRGKRAARARRQADVAEPAQRRGRLAAAEELVDHRGAPALDLGVRHRASRGARPSDLALADAAVASRARLPHEPLRRAGRVDRRGRSRVSRVGDAADGARLRDRRHRDQGRLVRPAAAARRAPRAPALGARVQVGADDGGDAAERDQDSSRVGRVRSTRGRCSSRSRSAA